MAESDVTPVSLTGWPVLTVRQAAILANVSRDTVERWARQHGIGRQFAPGTQWRISRPALLMVRDCDLDALELFRAGEADDDRVLRYLSDREVSAA